MQAVALSFCWALLLALFSIPTIIQVAHARELLDRPNHRTVHKKLTPRLGGAAIFAGFVSATTIFGDFSDGVQYILAGSMIIFFIGIKDDLATESAFRKLVIQILAAGIVMIPGDIRIQSLFGIFGIQELPLWFSYGLTLFVIIAITNAINLIDGLDGLAGTITLTILITFGLNFWRKSIPLAGVSLALAGGIIGFLRYNIHKAKIFMGDSGSLTVGFVVATLAVQFIQLGMTPSAPAVAFSILIIPIFDTLRVFTVRIARGKSPFEPDKNHLHHRLMALGIPQLGVVAILVGINMVVIAYSIYYAHLGIIRIGLSVFGFMLVLNAINELFLQRQKRQAKLASNG
ncbi:MAG TPA: undecaprenyl/decaprenyl-phosphate alpha-N-acetylglucosaminyl 1-phosphate transferase [Cytophagales bacterium]|nr:undecaprenyl/decaprenyl-phosphate alpha-N-acetylglucosaminyl 1-phosphate transferase [Cytophagales bacterium]HAA18501.1 undecaprenyl/decaprenyl-phosphate alpha-N-acetylglucosaminyl 1-phosphate transferase [Cytophagales bacterium]HAP58510.1 undecaprenyl/decaprenyl-phosphate alpha-N-acetylglucosaminyl 1-phosphate transferase [Cytophagales bacterium]